jgi:DNA (cytosine-5)-methyltransferase 1
MSKDLLVRDIPKDLRDWIDSNRTEYMMTQQEFVMTVLRRASETRQPYLPFFVTDHVENTNGRRGFTFIDLFAGIGGFRIALERLGGKCVFSSEWDKYSQKTYKNWFGEVPHGDIRKINYGEIPDHEIMAAGFPCQPFSIAGVSKKNSLGHAHGFSDSKQGNLFFNLATIISVKRPPVLFLENVKNLTSHDQGRTWQVIQKTLEELDYWVFYKVIDAAGWVPQHRERIYIVCFDKKKFRKRPSFSFPEPATDAAPQLKDILETSIDKKYTLSDHLWNYLQEYSLKHKLKGNGFGFGIANPTGVTRTLSARYYKDGSEILVKQNGKNPRRLTPRECARLMGFPDELPIVVSDTQAYRQFGNAVIPKIVQSIGAEITQVLETSISNQER